MKWGWQCHKKAKEEAGRPAKHQNATDWSCTHTPVQPPRYLGTPPPFIEDRHPTSERVVCHMLGRGHTSQARTLDH